MSFITPLSAAILGCVEGLTEFLPVSSTGHLILTSHLLGLNDDRYKAGVDAFNIVIQFGALLAIVGLYLPRVKSMILGLLGRDPAGRALVIQLFIAFLPAAVIGLLAEKKIKAYLFDNPQLGVWPVVVALAGGGVFMIVEETRRRRHLPAHEPEGTAGRSLAEMTLRAALIIGFAQCIAMWPGTSRSMVTILAALLLGFSPKAAAEFSFLLALPTLGAATAHDLLKHGHDIMQASGGLGLAIGFVISFIVAWVAVKSFLAYLTRHGMALFGWYRVALAAVVALLMR